MADQRYPKMRPRLQIPTPQPYPQRPPSTAGSIHSNPLYVPMYPNFNNMQPMTPTTAMPQNPYYNPFMNPGKASDFMFKQFEGFKDFTMNTAKSGLSVGEKSAFWMYGKISTWSKKWFTHIFLFLCIVAYTAAGASLFMAIEGVEESGIKKDTLEEKQKFITEFRKIMENKISLEETPAQWEGDVMKWVKKFERRIKEWNDMDSEKPKWNFWNSLFYCGTIYTTIGNIR